MIIHFSISAEHMDIDDKLRAYIGKKLAGLDKQLPRKQRDALRGSVVMTWSPAGYSCHASIWSPDFSYEVDERLPNAFSAVDLAEAKLRAEFERGVHATDDKTATDALQ